MALTTDSFFKRLGLLLRMRHWLRDFYLTKVSDYRSLSQANYYQEGNLLISKDPSIGAANWSLNGVSIHENTDKNGIIYINIYGVDTIIYVELYKDSALSNLIASGFRTGSGSLALNEQNNSGVSGTVTVSGSTFITKLDYDGSMGEPDSVGWTLWGPDKATAAGGVLNIAVAAGDGTVCAYGKNVVLDPAKGYEVEFKLRVNLSALADGRVAIQVKDSSSYKNNFYFATDVIDCNGLSVVFDSTDWHVYKMVRKDANLKLYIDGDPTPVYDQDITDPSGVIYNVFFGDVMMSQDTNADWEYISATSGEYGVPPVLICRPDWNDRLIKKFTEAGRDKEMLNDLMSMLESNKEIILSRISALDSIIENKLLRTHIPELLGEYDSTLLNVIESGSGGTIKIEYSGLLEKFYNFMVANADTIANNTTAAASIAYDALNIGKGTMAVSVHEHADAGSVTLECIDETIGSEGFSVRFEPNDEIFGTRRNAYGVIIKRNYKNNDIGISALKISRTISESGDTGTVFSNWYFDGESADNTDEGRLYIKYDGAIVEVYSDPNRINLVARGKAAGAGPESVDLTEQNGSGLSGSVTVTAGAANNNIALDLQTFKEGDRITFSITRTIGGLFQDFFNEKYRYSLPGAAFGAETITDQYVRRG